MRKKYGSQGQFLEKLKEAIKSLRDMKPGEVHVLSINANYGHYQIVIGPEQNREGTKNDHSRPIEINGEIHHLFVSPNSIRPQPSKRQMTDNLKDTIIMRDLKIHIVDPKGDGHHLADSKESDNAISAHECINLAGQNGEKLRAAMERSSRLAMAAYKIAQEDILRSIRGHREDTLESLEH